MLTQSSPKSRKSISATKEVLLLARPMGVSWVWDVFLVVPQTFQCDLEAYTPSFRKCRNGHMSNSFYSWSASFVGFKGVWKHVPHREKQREARNLYNTIVVGSA